MQRKRIWVLGVVLTAVAVMALPLTGCTTDSTGATDADTTADLPAQDGLEVGIIAPDFRMQSQDQVTVALKDYVGTKNVVVVFYPADFTPV